MNAEPDSDPNAKDDESKVHAEEVKDQHTTHWDRDYLSKEELDAAYREGLEKSNAEEADESDR
ncbi:hypothetical protein [Stieleria mannarensis]|uniref:hypothetical protein n=1 Tax=Stieleria mannarensis TaxID=2755585 RepID=UPI0015FF4765|nr:hypothetical protein [Rhodopirellula sp. JC639]